MCVDFINLTSDKHIAERLPFWSIDSSVFYPIFNHVFQQPSGYASEHQNKVTPSPLSHSKLTVYRKRVTITMPVVVAIDRGQLYFFTIWMTSSSSSVWSLPTFCGLCLTDEPQTSALKERGGKKRPNELLKYHRTMTATILSLGGLSIQNTLHKYLSQRLQASTPKADKRYGWGH